MAQDMANRVELMGSRIVIESVCRERGGILLGLHGVRVHAEKETLFFVFPNEWEIPMGFSLCFSKEAPVAKYG
jgi:hypothetical protein